MTGTRPASCMFLAAEVRDYKTGEKMEQRAKSGVPEFA